MVQDGSIVERGDERVRQEVLRNQSVIGLVPLGKIRVVGRVVTEDEANQESDGENESRAVLPNRVKVGEPQRRRGRCRRLRRR
jgi:hypothetical protein